MSTFQVASNRPSVQVKIVSQGDLLTTFDEPIKEVVSGTIDEELLGSTPIEGAGLRKGDDTAGFQKNSTSHSIFSGLSRESQNTLQRHLESYQKQPEDGLVLGFSDQQRQMHTICMGGLQQQKSDFRKLNRSNVYSQHFSVNVTLQEFAKTLNCVELMISLMTYLDTWVVASSDLEVLLCDYENRSSQDNYGSDQQCFEEYLLVCRYQHILDKKRQQSGFWMRGQPSSIPSTSIDTQDEQALATEEIARMEDMYNVGHDNKSSSLKGAGTVTRARERVLRRVAAIVHRVNKEINRPLESLMSRHSVVRKRLLWLSSSARMLPKLITDLGSKYYRSISWRVQFNEVQSSSVSNSGSLSKLSTDDNFYDHLILLCEKVVQTQYPALWPRLRGEISRLFRSSRFSQSIGRQRARDNTAFGKKGVYASHNKTSAQDATMNSNSNNVEVTPNTMRGSGNGRENEESESGKTVANPYTVLPSISNTAEYVSLTSMGVHSALAFLLLGTHQASVPSALPSDKAPPTSRKQALADILQRLSQLREDKAKPTAGQGHDAVDADRTSALLPVIPVVVPPKMRHIELHHFYEVDYKDMKYEPTTIAAPFADSDGIRNNKVFSFPTTTNAPLCVSDQRTPLLDVVHPAHSSLQKFQKNMIRARALALAEERRTQAEQDYEEPQPVNVFHLQPAYISQVDLPGMLRPGMRGETHLKNTSKKSESVKNDDPRPRYMRGMDLQGSYLDDPTAISFSSFSSNSTVNTVGIKRPTRAMRKEMDRTREKYNLAQKPIASVSSVDLHTIDSNKQLKTKFTKQLVYADTFDRANDIDYLATIISEEQKIYFKSPVSNKNERSDATSFKHIVPIHAQIDSQDSLETLIVQYASKQQTQPQ